MSLHITRASSVFPLSSTVHLIASGCMETKASQVFRSPRCVDCTATPLGIPATAPRVALLPGPRENPARTVCKDKASQARRRTVWLAPCATRLACRGNAPRSCAATPRFPHRALPGQRDTARRWLCHSPSSHRHQSLLVCFVSLSPHPSSWRTYRPSLNTRVARNPRLLWAHASSWIRQSSPYTWCVPATRGMDEGSRRYLGLDEFCREK